MPDRVLYILNILILALIYFVAAKIGLRINAGFATFVWLPIGIALAALFLYGYRLWPGIAIGSFMASFIIGGSWEVALGISAGNTLEALAGVYILRRYMKLDYAFERLRDAMGFLLVALSMPVIGATVGVSTLWLAGIVIPPAITPTWVIWWLGDVLGVLTITPFLICWLSKPFLWRTMPMKKRMEGMLLFTALVGINIAAFLTPYTQLGYLPVIYFIVMPFIWAAIRSGPHGTTLSIFITSSIGFLAVMLNYGIFAQAEVLARFFETGTFLVFVALIFLPFTSIVAEEENTSRVLSDHVQRLGDALKKISSEDKAKNEFLAILAHELRNPLSPVVSSLELMNMKVAEINRPDMLKIIKTSETHVRIIARLLDDLLDISYISRKKFRFEKETVELQSIINYAKETVDAFYISRNHRLTISVPKKLIWISADPVRVEQILNNVLYNAAKYTDMGGDIKLSVARDDEKQEVVIRVQDNGIGIESDMLEKIFEPFFQKKQNKDARAGTTGLGIGLALTKRLVELHGGSIRAISAGLGKGSEFIITLPLLQDVQLRMEAPSKDRRRVKRSPYFTFMSSKIKGNQYPILIVDDNKDAADGIKMLLERSGYKAAVAYDGEGALTKVKKIHPKVVVLDICLPDISGYKVAEILRKEFGDSLTLIALTGYGQNKDKLEAKKAGFNYHMTKPISINELKNIVEENKG